MSLYSSTVNLSSVAYPGVGDLELSQYVLWHVVLGHRVDDEVLIPSRALAGPVLVALLSSHLTQFTQHDDDGRVVFPQHAPEVLRRLRQRALRRDVRLAIAVALCACVNIQQLLVHVHV